MFADNTEIFIILELIFSVTYDISTTHLVDTPGNDGVMAADNSQSVYMIVQISWSRNGKRIVANIKHDMILGACTIT